MAERVKVRFIRNSPPYFVGDVAGWEQEEAERMVNVLKVAEFVVEEAKEAEATPVPVPAAKPAAAVPKTAETPKPVAAPAASTGT